MKKFLTVLILALAPRLSFASTVPASNVRQIAPNGVSCSSTTIGTSAVELTGNTTGYTSQPGVYDIEVWPLSSTWTYCSNGSGVTASGNSIGEPLPGWGQFATWGKNLIHKVLSPVQPFYCIGAAANDQIMVCKRR